MTGRAGWKCGLPTLLTAALLVPLTGCIEENPIAFSPDGKTVAFVTLETHGTQDGGPVTGSQAFRLMLLNEQRQIRVLETSTDVMLASPAFSPDGKRLAYLRVTLPTAEKAKQIQQDLEQRLEALKKLANPAWAAWATGEGVDASQTQPAVLDLRDLALPSAKGTYVAAAMMLVTPNTQVTLVERTLPAGQIVSQTTIDLPLADSGSLYTTASPLQYAPDGKRVFLPAAGMVLAISPESGEKQVLVATASGGLLSPNGQFLATHWGDAVGMIASDGQMALYRRVPDGSVACPPAWIDNRTLALVSRKAAATHPIATQSAAATQETQPAPAARLVLRKMRTDGTLLPPVEFSAEPGQLLPGNEPDLLAISPDGRHAAIAIDNSIIFATMDGKVLGVAGGDDLHLQQPAFSPDGARVAAKVVRHGEEKTQRTEAIVFFSAEGKELYRVAISPVEAAATQAASQPAVPASR